MSDSKNEVAIATETVMNQIFNIRGSNVMLDFHLAKLYQVENRALKQAVKRKQQRFPEEFIFNLLFLNGKMDSYEIYVPTHQR